MKIFKLQIVTVITLVISLTMPLATMAEESNPPLKETSGQNGQFNKQRSPSQGSGNAMPNKEQMQMCQEAFQKAEKDLQIVTNETQQQTKQTQRQVLRSNRQARFDLQVKFNKEMFDLETAFLDSKEAAEDTKDKVALKNAQDNFNKSKKALMQSHHQALRDLEKQVKSIQKGNKNSGMRPTMEMMQKVMPSMPQECQELMKKYMPKTDSAVKGAFIKASNALERQLQK